MTKPDVMRMEEIRHAAICLTQTEGSRDWFVDGAKWADANPPQSQISNDEIIERTADADKNLDSLHHVKLKEPQSQSDADEFPEPEFFKEALEQMKLGVATDSAYIRGARKAWKAARAKSEAEIEGLQKRFNEMAKIASRSADRECTLRDELTSLKAKQAGLVDALRDVVIEGHSNLCETMKPTRPGYICHVEIAEEALKAFDSKQDEVKS